MIYKNNNIRGLGLKITIQETLTDGSNVDITQEIYPITNQNKLLQINLIQEQ